MILHDDESCGEFRISNKSKLFLTVVIINITIIQASGYSHVRIKSTNSYIHAVIKLKATSKHHLF